MKKIALISSVPPPIGGIAKWTLRMLNSKLDNGWSIELVNDGIVGSRECFGDDIKYNLLDEIKRWARVWSTLFKVMLKREVLLAHSCPIATSTSMIVNTISAIIVRLCGKKHIAHFRCTVPNLIKTKKQKLQLKILCKLSNQIICLNSQSLNYLKGITKTPVVLIPNFVGGHEINKCDISPDIKTILYVGGVTKEKGCDDIVEIAKQRPSIIFKLVGDASSEIIELARQAPNVILLGPKSGGDLNNEWMNADIFIFMSRFWGEGFSNAVTEAMAYGLPCIVTNWAANADQIEDGKGGFVVDVHDIDGGVKAIDRMMDRGLREMFSRYNIDKTAKEYSAERILKEYVDCYDNLCVK